MNTIDKYKNELLTTGKTVITETKGGAKVFTKVLDSVQVEPNKLKILMHKLTIILL